MIPRCMLAAALLFVSWLPVTAQQPDKKPAEFPLGKGIRTVCFSPDGALVAAGFGEPKERGRVIVWDVKTQKPLWTHNEATGVPAVAFSPDGKTLAIGVYDHTAKLLEASSGRVTKTLRGHTNFVRAVAFSPDGKTLATGGWDQTVKLWDVDTGDVRHTLEFPGERLFGLTYSPGGQWLMASGGPLRIWDAKSGKEKRDLGDGRGVSVASAVFASDDWFLAGDNHGTVKLWSVASGEQRLRFQAYPQRIAFSPKARTLAVGSYLERPIELFDLTLQEPTAKQNALFQALLIKLDDDDYDTREATGRDVLKLGIVMEPALRRLMKESSSAEVRIRCRRLRDELLSKPRATLTGHTEQVESLAFSPDGLLLASGARDGTVRLWSLKENKEIARLVPSAP